MSERRDALLALAKKYTPRGMNLSSADGRLYRLGGTHWEIRWVMRRTPEDYFTKVCIADGENLGAVEDYLRFHKGHTDNAILDLLAEDAKR